MAKFIALDLRSGNISWGNDSAEENWQVRKQREMKGKGAGRTTLPGHVSSDLPPQLLQLNSPAYSCHPFSPFKLGWTSQVTALII